MGRFPATTRWKIGAAIGCLLLLLGAGFSTSHTTPSARTAWRENYRRPAEVPFPPDNPYSAAKNKLGGMLFFDPMLSGGRVRSCATCHNPGLAWGDGLPRAIGENQAVLPLRAPTLLNVAFLDTLGWDGKFHDLESVAFAPITAAGNMNLPEAALIERLTAVPGYVDAFTAVFGTGAITRRKIELALATFERSIVSGEAPFDRWINGDENAISPSAKRGFDLFNGKARCSSCHSGWTFTDGSFHDIGTAQNGDIGRGRLFPNSTKLQYAFKTPTLRDTTRRAPYMHDGSVATMAEVIALYNRGGIERPSRSVLIKPLGLTQDEITDLTAFLDTLANATEFGPVPILPR